jgi:glycosyltransferase involved in cell wall biosynthesis
MPFRLLSIVEASSLTGPVKPLLMFSRLARAGIDGHPPLTHTLLTTLRLRGSCAPVDNEMLRAARADHLQVDVARERFLFDPSVLADLARCIRARAPDIVETHDFKSHFLFWLLRRSGAIAGPRWVAYHHGYTRMSRRVRLYQHLDRLSLRHADRVVTLCQPFVSQLQARGVPVGRTVVISNAVAPRSRPPAAELAALRASLGFDAQELLIASVGRLSREKGHEDLIRAFRRLLERGPPISCRLLLVGDGGERGALMAQASDLGDKVVFTGHVSDPWPYFCIANLFVLPSHTEGSPLVLFEAMAAGLPIIATAVGGVPEVVQHGRDALLVPAVDVESLTGALSTLAGDAARAAALGGAAHESLRRFSPEAYAARLFDIYRGVMCGDSRE